MFTRIVIFLMFIFLPLFSYANSTDVKLEYGSTVIQNTENFTNQWTVVGVNGDSNQKVVLLGRLTGTHAGLFQYEFLVFTLGASSANVVDDVNLENILSQDTRLDVAGGNHITVRTNP